MPPFQPAYAPLADVLETPDEIIVFVDCPGFEQDEIRVEVDNQHLIISAQRSDELDEEEQFVSRERPTRLERTIQIPLQATVEDARAAYQNGVCRVTLPKNESERRRTIGFE
jgi:HSP20 family protein